MLFGFILIYWIGKYFYQLAEKYNRSKWLFAILGIVVYYLSQFVIGLFIGILNGIFDFGIDFNNVGVNLMGIPIGFLFVYLFYILLEKNWKKNKIEPIESINQIGQE